MSVAREWLYAFVDARYRPGLGVHRLDGGGRMDSFEQVIASILERRGYWTRTCGKVDLERDEKLAIGRASSPRWELDVVGYRGRDNQLLVLECKSYLDSFGVRSGTFAGKNAKDEKRYKLFFEPVLREVVLQRLIKQLVQSGFCAEAPRVTLESRRREDSRR